jgi:RHS repeat-associated protein
LVGNNTFAGEVTGDGESDVIIVRHYIDNNNIRHDTTYSVLDNNDINGDPLYTYRLNDDLNTVSEVQHYRGPGPVYIYGNKSLVPDDFDGDGKADILMVCNNVYSNAIFFKGVKINYSRKYTSNSPTYKTVTYSQLPHVNGYSNDFIYPQAAGNLDNPSSFVSGDFDGDGSLDYILILSNNFNVANSYKAFFSSPAKNIINQEIASFGVGGNSSDPFYATTVATAPVITPIDFDGDGKQEILVEKQGISYILSVFPVSAATGYNYSATVLYSFNSVVSGYRIFPGDFNGDGKTDLLVRTSQSNSTAPWNILYSTGKEYKSYPFFFQNRPILDGDNATSAHHIIIADFNNDGKSDIWHSLDLTTSTSRHALYISNGVPLNNNNSTSAFSIYDYTANSSINKDKTVQSVVGDFNSDGEPDILSIKGPTGKFIYPRPFKEENLMTSITNGLGAQTSLSYVNACLRSDTYEYDNASAPIGQGANGNPYTVLKKPMYVFNTLAEPNGLGEYKYTTMWYEDAMYHPLRGFLGFKKIVSIDWVTGIQGRTSTTYSDMNTDFMVPVVYKTTTSLSGTLLTETDVNNNLIRVNPNNYFDKRYVSQVSKSQSFNFLTGSGSETTNTYDDYGNITTAIVNVGPFSGTTITPIETTTSVTSYVSANTPVPSLPESITVTKSRGVGSSASKTTTYSYNSTGLLGSVTDFSGTTIANTSSNTYDDFGNVLTQSSSLSNTPVITNTYDPKGRHLLTKSTSGSGLIKTQTFDYDPLTDNISSSTTSDGLTTSFNYDGFGNLIKTTLPDGNIVISSIEWPSTYGRYSKTSYRQSDGGMWQKTYYDIVGREVRKETNGYNGLIYSTTQYNAQGLVYKQTQAQYSAEPTVEVTNTYDNLQRLTSVSNGSTTTNYSYSLADGGLFTTTTTNGASQSSSKTVDASGKVVKTNDNGGQLDFTYDSWGNQNTVKLGSTSLIVNTYNPYGRKISLTDKNAGMISYEYYPSGQLKKETDANNNFHTYQYDAFGRISSKTGLEGTISYTYYSNAGKVNDNLSSVTGFSGDIKTYQYDNLQRVISESTNFDQQPIFTKTFEYDANGNIKKTTYPSGVSINDTYDKNGILTQTSMTYGGVTKPLFTAAAMNSRGIYTGYTYGNGKSSTLDYDVVKGIPTRYYTSGIQDLNLDFDANTGNLKSRSDAIKGLTERFTYDDLNRLTASSVNYVQQFSMTYDNNSGNSLGNIKSKSDIGNYQYDVNKINAVRFITSNGGNPYNPPNVISTNTQLITYTNFLKAATIEENGYKLTYNYGEDYERIKSILKQGSTTLETKYYLGNYEKLIKNGTPSEIHYVGAGNGLCAIIVVKNGVATPYFVYSDHLGSPLTLTNSTGTVVAEQNFDAWGRYRNPTTWNYSSIPARPDWLYRGFTGHEHLFQFALINMNGRMYDPATCRMLSPDNYVPMRWNTQGYNRYAYANNNPLIYSDPDGNFFFLIPMLIGAAVGATTSAAIYSLSAGSSFNWSDFGKSAGIGAIGGAVGGGLGLISKNSAFGQFVSYGITQNVASQVAADIAFGQKITAESLFGAAVGGLIDGSIPKFKGIAFETYNFFAGAVNAVAELAINTARGAVIGGLSSEMGGGNFEDGVRSGATGGFIRTAADLALLGPTIRPTGDIKDALNKEERNLKINLTGAYGPTYRIGGLWQRGLTLNGFSMINDNGEGVNNVGIWVHESYHYYQMLKQSWAVQFTHGIYEQWWLAPFKGIDVYYGDRLLYNEAAAQYYQEKIYPYLK